MARYAAVVNPVDEERVADASAAVRRLRAEASRPSRIGRRFLHSAPWAYAATAVLATLLRPGTKAFLVPLAGPWAARVYGHG